MPGYLWEFDQSILNIFLFIEGNRALLRNYQATLLLYSQRNKEQRRNKFKERAKQNIEIYLPEVTMRPKGKAQGSQDLRADFLSQMRPVTAEGILSNA